MASKTRQKIQSLDRGLQILEYIASHKSAVTLQDLSDLLGVEKSSAYRLAQTMVDRGYLRQDLDTLGYVLGNKVFTLANGLAGHRNVQDFSRKYLKLLAMKTGETAHLAVRGAMGAVLVDHEFGNNPVAVTTCWGSTEPYHCTALGKALLAGMNEDELRDIVGADGLSRYTEATVICFGDLLKQCQSVKASQIAFDREEFRKGMNCLASPVYDFRGQIVAAIGISGPSDRVKKSTIKSMVEFVRKYARELSGELGYREIGAGEDESAEIS